MIPVDYYRIVDFQKREIEILREVIRLWTDMPNHAKRFMRDADMVRIEIKKIEEGVSRDKNSRKN